MSRYAPTIRQPHQARAIVFSGGGARLTERFPGWPSRATAGLPQATRCPEQNAACRAIQTLALRLPELSQKQNSNSPDNSIRQSQHPVACGDPARGLGHPRERRPLGFTLVEVLVVIVILGLIVGLVVNGLGSTKNAARNAVVSNELYALDFAVRNYSGQFGELPPTMISNSSTMSPAFQQNDYLDDVFTRHVRRVFPRYDGFFDDIERGIEQATVPASAGYVPSTGCNVKSLDAAESLVFWLGGLPRIIEATQDRYEVELTGFSADPQAPFLSQADQPKRTEMLFEFDRRRLVDTDQDGWPEYVPNYDGAGTATPPYVYFDSRIYSALPSYPEDWHPALASAAGSWGFARPYLLTYTPDAANDPEEHPKPSDFAAADSFQLLCAGGDNMYSELTSFSPADLNAAQNQLTVYPRGQFVVRKQTTWHPIDVAQYDNLTNFLDSTLEQALGGPQ